MKKINFKQPKYVIPTLVYIGSLVIPYLFMEVFDVEIEDKKDANLQTTEYLNAQLPSANVSKDIGSKRKNMRDAFGEITDRSAVQDFTENQDMSSDDYVVPMTDEERAKALAMRRQGMMAELDRDLNNVRAQGAAAIGAVADAQDSIISKGAKAARDVADEAPNAVRELDDDAQNNIVTKVSKDESEYFNTLSENAPNSNLIRAIIDEEVKAVEGSRVRLRLLDAIDINGTQLPKGSYLYATMSGFGQQQG